MKSNENGKIEYKVWGRSRKGAWIEMFKVSLIASVAAVAPARERGLKYFDLGGAGRIIIVAPARERGLKLRTSKEKQSPWSCRSRKGAWIEIRAGRNAVTLAKSRSRKGAWIEMGRISKR